MTDDDPTLSVARDLREIGRLSARLEDEAVNRSDDHEMPGGDALVALAPVANLEAWGYRLEAAERAYNEGRGVEPFVDEPEWEPPLQTLLFWSEAWRIEHGSESDLRPTLASEQAWLAGVLSWAWDNEPHWDDFARDIRNARIRLENVLYDGIRAERSRVPCMDCEPPVKLIHLYADKVARDHWRCPRCIRLYERDEFTRAKHLYLWSEGADRFIRVADAIAAVRPRPEHTVRTWIKRGQVRRICDVQTRQVMVWWPDVRALNEAAKHRARVRRSA